LIAIINQMRVDSGDETLDGPSQTLPTLYHIYSDPTRYAADFRDITSGNNGYDAGTGYDLVTGLGSPIASNLATDFLRAKTTTAVSASANLSNFGQSLTFTATVTTAAPGAGTPPGTVSFYDGTTLLGTAPLSVVDGNNQATFTTAALPAGTHSVIARYSGDYDFGASARSVQVTVEGDTTTLLSSSANPTVFGQALTFTATVSLHVPGDTPTGTVQFYVNGQAFGAPVTLNDGIATIQASTLPVGRYSIRGDYSGNAGYRSSVSPTIDNQVINPATTTTVVSPSANPSAYGQALTFTATVAANAPGAGTPAGTVQFLIDGVDFGPAVTLSGGRATCGPISTLSVGNHSITAVYSGDTNDLGSTSDPVSQGVNPDATTTMVGASANPSAYGQALTFTATVAANAPGAGTPTGTVQFLIDGVDFGPAVTLSGGRATCGPISTLSVGNHSITAVYSGDTNFQDSTSNALSQTVNTLPTSISVSAASAAVVQVAVGGLPESAAAPSSVVPS
jgi:hypothetical protein